MHILTFLVFFIATALVSGSEDTRYDQFPMPVYNSPLASAAIEVIKVFFVPEAATLYITFGTEAVNHYLQGFINEILYSVKPDVIVQIEEIDNMAIKFPRVHNVIIIDGWIAFLKIHEHMTSEYYDFKGYYLIVMTGQSVYQQQMLRLIFACMWRLHIVNANVLVPVQNKMIAQMFTNYPYTRFACEGIYPVVLNTFQDGRFEKSAATMFPDKLSNFHNCPLTVAIVEAPPFMIMSRLNDTYQFEGIEGILLQVLAKRLKFTIKVVVPENNTYWGVIGNKTTPPTGAAGLVIEEKVNFTIGFYGGTNERHTAMTPSQVYFSSSLILCVPPGGSFIPFKKLFLPFHRIIWTLIVAIFVLTVLVTAMCKCQKRLVRNFLFGPNNETPILNAFNVFFGGSVPNLPRRNFARTMFGLWLWYCFIIRSSYTAKSFDFMKRNIHKPIKNTLGELKASNYKVYVNMDGKTYVHNMFSDSSMIVYVSRQQFEEYVDKVHDPDFKGAIVSSAMHVGYRNMMNKDKPMLRIATETLMALQIAIYFPKASCLIEVFDGVIEDIVSSGLIGVWKYAVVPQRFFNTQESDDAHTPKALTFYEARGVFKAYGYALAFACVAFVVELLSLRVRWLKIILDAWQRQQ